MEESLTQNKNNSNKTISEGQYEPMKMPINTDSQHTTSTASSTYIMDPVKDENSLAKKEEEAIRLKQEINDCQEQLSSLTNLVKQLEVNMEGRKSTKKSKKRRGKKPVRRNKSHSDNYSVDEEESWLDSDWCTESQEPLQMGSGHSNHSTHSNQSYTRSCYRSHRSCRQSYCRSQHGRSRGGIRSIRRDSLHSSRSSFGGNDDGASVVTNKSLHSTSLSVKSLPREIELMEEEEKEKDDFTEENSLFDESYRSVRSANASTDTIQVENREILDPYGERGVYSGALSKSTGMPNGKGLLEYKSSGRWCEGDWIHGRLTGTCRLSNGSGDFYEGDLKNDHFHGTGVMKFADGRVYEGDYNWGQMTVGKMTYQDGSVYDGSWSNGARHGSGKCIFADGSEYEGDFWEGDFHGQGQMTWNDGGFYCGTWRFGQMHGKGKEVRANGSVRHDGEWCEGQPVRSGKRGSPLKTKSKGAAAKEAAAAASK